LKHRILKVRSEKEKPGEDLTIRKEQLEKEKSVSGFDARGKHAI
jgi:hypothetical protein